MYEHERYCGENDVHCTFACETKTNSKTGHPHNKLRTKANNEAYRGVKR